MFNLIKKDFLIIKKMWMIVLILAFLIPIFVSFVGENMKIPGGIILAIVSNLLGTMLFSSIFEEEEKYPKAAALITTIGYSRKIQVGARYLLGIGVFLWCFLAYLLDSFFIQGLSPVTLFDVVVSFFSFSAIMSLYLSMTIKYGIKWSRYIVMAVILFISLGPTLVSRLRIQINLSVFHNLNEYVGMGILVAGAVVFYLVSLKSSLLSYASKEL